MKTNNMENMNKDKIDMEHFIPSETYKKFLKDKHINLTPRQAAKLINRSKCSFEERWMGFKELIRSELTDDELREKLQTIVDYEMAFVGCECAEHESAVYILEEYVPEDDYERNEIGAFASIRQAERLGWKTGNEFVITRHITEVLSEEKLSEFEDQLCQGGYIDTNHQAFYYNTEGKLWSIDRMYGEDDVTEYDAYSDAKDYIENIFADFPLCFKNGDIVRTVSDHRLEGRYGIMHVFPDREEQIARLNSIPGMVPDDEELVEFMDEDGEFGHCHMLVAELERVEDDKIPKRLQLVLECASDLVKGRETIDALQYAILRMKNAKEGI